MRAFYPLGEGVNVNETKKKKDLGYNFEKIQFVYAIICLAVSQSTFILYTINVKLFSGSKLLNKIPLFLKVWLLELKIQRKGVLQGAP